MTVTRICSSCGCVFSYDAETDVMLEGYKGECLCTLCGSAREMFLNRLHLKHSSRSSCKITIGNKLSRHRHGSKNIRSQYAR